MNKLELIITKISNNTSTETAVTAATSSGVHVTQTSDPVSVKETAGWTVTVKEY